MAIKALSVAIMFLGFASAAAATGPAVGPCSLVPAAQMSPALVTLCAKAAKDDADSQAALRPVLGLYLQQLTFFDDPTAGDDASEQAVWAAHDSKDAAVGKEPSSLQAPQVSKCAQSTAAARELAFKIANAACSDLESVRAQLQGTAEGSSDYEELLVQESRFDLKCLVAMGTVLEQFSTCLSPDQKNAACAVIHEHGADSWVSPPGSVQAMCAGDDHHRSLYTYFVYSTQVPYMS